MQDAGLISAGHYTFYWQIVDGEVWGFLSDGPNNIQSTRGFYRTASPAVAAERALTAKG